MSKAQIKHRAHKVIATEIYKTFNNLNPEYMRTIFQKQSNIRNTRQTLNLKSQSFRTKKYGFNSLRVLAPMIWNSIHNKIKASKGIAKLKENIKPWGNENCDFLKKFETYYNTIK